MNYGSLSSDVRFELFGSKWFFKDFLYLSIYLIIKFKDCLFHFSVTNSSTGFWFLVRITYFHDFLFLFLYFTRTFWFISLIGWSFFYFVNVTHLLSLIIFIKCLTRLLTHGLCFTFLCLISLNSFSIYRKMVNLYPIIIFNFDYLFIHHFTRLTCYV